MPAGLHVRRIGVMPVQIDQVFAGRALLEAWCLDCQHAIEEPKWVAETAETGMRSMHGELCENRNGRNG
jgi:hypothetical protein